MYLYTKFFILESVLFVFKIISTLNIVILTIFDPKTAKFHYFSPKNWIPDAHFFAIDLSYPSGVHEKGKILGFSL